MKLLNPRWILLWMCLILAQSAWSAEEKTMQRLFLTPEQRAEIDAQRAAFLKHPTETMAQDFSLNALASPAATLSKTKAKSKKPAKPLTISAIVLLPNGDQLVRINQRFYKVTTKMDSAMATQVIVQGKSVLVPVGETYFPDKKQWLKSYDVNSKGVVGSPSKMDIKIQDDRH